MKETLLSLLLSSSGSLAFAQTDSPDTGKLSISGYLDSYYLTAFNRPKSGNLLGVDQLTSWPAAPSTASPTSLPWAWCR